ncbi:MAG: type IX secretion system membrane protein PorP/SprF, partial [Sphingobacteriia bacterium]
FSDNTVSLTQGRLVPHLFLSAGYRLALSEELNLLPSVLVRYISPLPLGFDVNAKLQYLDLAWVGASYRNKDGFAAMVGMNISHSFNIGYSYDVQTSRINTISRGTHEILLGFQIGNRYGDWCPRKLW